MNLMFWKKKADTGEDAETSQKSSAEETVVRKSDDSESHDTETSDQDDATKPGLGARIKSRLAAFIRRFRKPPAFQAEEESAQDDSGHSKSTPEDTSPTEPVSSKKRLILGGAIALVILLLIGTGFAVWKIFLSTSEEDDDISATVEPPRNVRPAPHAVIPRAEIEALKKKNDELQAQVEALKKEPQQLRPIESTVSQASDNIRSQSASGEITIDNKDPKTTAMSLKEAIDAMNEGSD
jgi:cell division protein FtsB